MEYACGTFDDDDFTASELCCACWDRPSNPAINLSDFSGVSKAKLATLLLQGVNLNSIKSRGFTVAQEAKALFLMTTCQSGSAVDSFGDSCSWYAEYPGSCGFHDHAGFNATSECCECGGGYCVDSSATDSFGDGCSWYTENPGYCG